MNIKESKQTGKEHILSEKLPGSGPSVRPGYINFGSRLDHKNSLKARIKAEIDRAIKGGGS